MSEEGREFTFVCKPIEEKVENELKEREDCVTLIAGTINANVPHKLKYWKNEHNLEIRDYAIAENKDDYDLINVVGIIHTTEDNADLFSETSYSNMKNIVKSLDFDDFFEDFDE